MSAGRGSSRIDAGSNVVSFEATRTSTVSMGWSGRSPTAGTGTLTGTKRTGVTESFSRAKVASGVRKACQGRAVSEDDLALLAQTVEESVRASGCAEIASHDVGLAILGPLRDLDEIAYLRFASVYRDFQDLSHFQEFLETLRGDGNRRDGAKARERPLVSVLLSEGRACRCRWEGAPCGALLGGGSLSISPTWPKQDGQRPICRSPPRAGGGA